MKFNREKYLHRIKYSGSIEPNLDTLRKLQKAHLLNVPFENLDIHYKTPIELNIDRIYEKVIKKNRGGFCYELNGLFFELLCSFGYDVKRISAKVYIKDNQYSPEYDHIALITKINGVEYLTDVGFGEFIFEPLKIEFDLPQEDPRGMYIVDNYDGDYIRINKIENDNLTPEFIFKNIGRDFKEFADMCLYHQSNPNSHFMKKRLISLPTENGRITISGNTLKIQELESTTEKELGDESEFENELWHIFKVKLEKPLANTL